MITTNPSSNSSDDISSANTTNPTNNSSDNNNDSTNTTNPTNNTANTNSTPESFVNHVRDRNTHFVMLMYTKVKNSNVRGRTAKENVLRDKPHV